MARLGGFVVAVSVVVAKTVVVFSFGSYTEIKITR